MPDPTQNQAGDEPFDEEEFDAEEAERRIAEFIASADELPGPSVEDLAEQVSALMRVAWTDIEEIMSGEAHNKVLAAQLLLGQKARALQPEDPEQWRLYASTMLLSGMVVRNTDG